MLKSGKFYGYKARAIYEKCCDEYGFKKELSGKFAPHNILYAGKATTEDFGVWFISNSNWTKTKGGSWQNTIAGSFNWIEEKWNTTPDKDADCFDYEKRVVFAKDPGHADGYIFLGVYEPVSYNDRNKTRRFERVETGYEAAA